MVTKPLERHSAVSVQTIRRRIDVFVSAGLLCVLASRMGLSAVTVVVLTNVDTTESKISR